MLSEIVNKCKPFNPFNPFNPFIQPIQPLPPFLMPLGWFLWKVAEERSQLVPTLKKKTEATHVKPLQLISRLLSPTHMTLIEPISLFLSLAFNGSPRCNWELSFFYFMFPATKRPFTVFMQLPNQQRTYYGARYFSAQRLSCCTRSDLVKFQTQKQNNQHACWCKRGRLDFGLRLLCLFLCRWKLQSWRYSLSWLLPAFRKLDQLYLQMSVRLNPLAEETLNL